VSVYKAVYHQLSLSSVKVPV